MASPAKLAWMAPTYSPACMPATLAPLQVATPEASVVTVAEAPLRLILSGAPATGLAPAKRVAEIVVVPPYTAVAVATDSDVGIARPSPDTWTDAKPCDPLSVSVSMPIRVPTAAGVKLKLTVHIVPAASLSGASGQSVPMMANSPVIDIEPMVTGPVPELVNSATLKSLLVVPTWVGRTLLAPEKVRSGLPGGVVMSVASSQVSV